MKRPTRILHIYRTFFPDTQGGAEETIRQLTTASKALGLDARILVPSSNPKPIKVEIAGVTVIRCKLHFEIASCGFALTSLPEFNRQVAWADIIHYHFPWPFADLLNLIGRSNKPYVVTYHSDIVRQAGLMRLYGPLMRRFLIGAEAVVATSTQYAESSQVLQSLGRSIDVVPLGIDPATYPKAGPPTKERMLNRFGTDYFFFVGMLRYYKGLHILLEACRGTNFPVVIAGVGPLEVELKSIAKSYDLPSVQFAGRVTDEEKVALIENSKALVFPSHVRSEAFGITLLEGLMLGKPLITAEVGTGTSYVNEHDETGFIVPSNDAKALQAAMDKMITDHRLVSQFGVAARERFDRLFTADSMARDYESIYLRMNKE